MKFEEGQLIRVVAAKDATEGKEPQTLGPYLVVTKLSDVTPRAKPLIVHNDRLKPYTGVAVRG